VEHFALTIGYCVFFVVHVVQVLLAGWKNFRSMITGFDVFPIEEKREEPEAVIEVPEITPVNS
jgi:hypothetical protein